jgi:hypothetical protein
VALADWRFGRIESKREAHVVEGATRAVTAGEDTEVELSRPQRA